jgi:tRNA (mo5U34)-methyltransferase
MAETTADDASSIRWFHSIDLGGEITPGFKSNDLLNQEASVVFSYPVKGRSFLDVGAWDGFFSFQAEARGACRVVATDWFCWGGPGWGTKAGFDFARRRLRSGVEDIEIDVPDISPDSVGVFDIVLLSGVI